MGCEASVQRCSCGNRVAYPVHKASSRALTRLTRHFTLWEAACDPGTRREATLTAG